MKNVLVTGAGGFVGLHLVEYLTKIPDLKVFALSYSASDGLTRLLPSEQIMLGDLQDFRFTRDAFVKVKPDYTIHLAALSRVNDSFEKAREVLAANTTIQFNVLEAMREIAPQSRLLSIGSANGYGLVDRKHIPMDETTPFRPLNPYAVSKITQEYLSLQYHLAYNLDIVLLRPFNHTGEGQTDNFVISALAKQVAEIEGGLREPVLKVGNLNSVRDFTDVKDMVRAYYLAAEKCVAGETYNIGSSRGVTIEEVINILLKLSTKKIQVVQEGGRLRNADVPVLIANIGKFSGVTGWKPEIPLAETVSRVLGYWRQQIEQVQ